MVKFQILFRRIPTLETWGSPPKSPTPGGGRSMPPVILRRRRPGIRNNRRALFIAPPGLDPGPGIFAWSSAPHGPTFARLGPIKAAAQRATLPAQPLDLPSRQKLILRALGQCSRGEVIMHENATGRGCIAASLLSPWDIQRRPLRVKGGSGSIPKMLRQAAMRGDRRRDKRLQGSGRRGRGEITDNLMAMPART